ncbi:MAG: hypothetical protein JXB19_02940 [Bacteroidales bacterium]|nr:hypothetical protein [Bacteroidales bacterium]
MKSAAPVILFLLLIIIGTINCKRNQNVISGLGIDSINLDQPVPMKYMYDTTGVGLPIFYNMYLSVELSSLFESSGAVFEQVLLNPTDKVTDYITSSKKALNLGVFAVDLSYSRVFEQLDIAASYFNAMQRMAEELGIPSNYFENTAQRFERNINNKDSLIKIANEVYMATDTYLKENERYGAASLVIIGGWVEAVYIACDVAAGTGDYDILERLAEQRYSLGNLLGMLKNYEDDVMIEKYITDLTELQPYFDSFVVKIHENFNPDSPEGRQEIQGYLDIVSKISTKVTAIRNEIVE